MNCQIEKFGPLGPNECETDLRKIGCIKFNWKLDSVSNHYYVAYFVLFFNLYFLCPYC